jgi:predicted GTPase
VVYAGVDYAAILAEAEREADVLVWDGGNNDTSFLAADVYVTVVDPHRAGHELTYHPGETNLRLADVVLVNKVDTADPARVRLVRENVARVNPRATIVEAASPPRPDAPAVLEGRRVLAVEDGPTLTHGGMRYGAATLAARALGARLVDPRPFAVGELAETFARYPELGPLLPAMGYGERQVRDLAATIARAAAEGGVEAVAVGTPIELAALMALPVPHTRVRYELEVRGAPTLADVLAPLLDSAPAGGPLPAR